jgi:predicted  nucleic acid-binding Zn-ribbon protein
MDDSALMQRMQRSAHARPTVQQVFSAPIPPPKDTEPSTPAMESMMAPISPPNVGNIFEFSEDDFPTIPAALMAPLLDSAVEISETDSHPSSVEDVNAREKSLTALTASPTIKLGPAAHDRSQSFSFGQTVFRSLGGGAAAESSPAMKQVSPSQRNRALSDTIFTSMIHSPTTALHDPLRPEADINDTSQAVVAYQPPPIEKDRDPFAANASTYYGPGTMIPPSPPQSNHTRTASREEDMIWSLRTQLALQSELCAQYEVDLSAKDELVEMLNARLGESEKELERRRAMIRTWRKRVADLEKCIKGLEDEVDRSREEIVDRSVMDEASGEALRELHRRISELERDKKENDHRETDLRVQLDTANTALAKAQEDLRTRDQSERELKAGIRAAKEEMEQMGQLDGQANEDERERHLAAQSAWEEERSSLVASNASLHDDHIAVQSQLTGLREEVVRKEDELAVLKAELEAQWKHTEQAGEEMEKLKQEKAELAQEAVNLREKLVSMDSNWEAHEQKRLELENELHDAWAAREELDKERDEVSLAFRMRPVILKYLIFSWRVISVRNKITPKNLLESSRNAKTGCQPSNRNASTLMTASRASRRTSVKETPSSRSTPNASVSVRRRRKNSVRGLPDRNATMLGSLTSKAARSRRLSHERLRRVRRWSNW